MKMLMMRIDTSLQPCAILIDFEPENISIFSIQCDPSKQEDELLRL